MKIQIRQATKADAELIAELSRQTFRETYAAQNSIENIDAFLARQFTREALIAEVGAAGNTFLLAYMDSAAVGYVRLCDSEPGRLEIARIYAATAIIGKGVGKALMQASIACAQKWSKKAVWLGVWEKNERAINFYTAWGFQKVDEKDFLLGSDRQRDWIMQKNL